MLWVWIGWLVKSLFRLVIPPPKKAAASTIDWRKPCPACGHIGTVTVEYRVITTKPGKADAIRKGLMWFECSYCKCHWHTAPLYVRTPIPGQKPLGPDEIGGKEIQGLTV